MAGQKTTRRQKDISRLLRDKKYCPPRRSKKNNPFSRKKSDRTSSIGTDDLSFSMQNFIPEFCYLAGDVLFTKNS